jgi:O-antigen/teichoic acid export membrane protein
MTTNTVRIAKNTLALYFRQILIMLVSLYTVRVVLNTLGAEDYGIYNVTAGVVTMFGFLSNSTAIASQRYFSIVLGQDNIDKFNHLFSISLTIYMLIAVLILFFAETAGFWFVSNKLVIPLERKSAAFWVYQFSILSFLITILSSPYIAAIIAHEDMNIYAYISIIEIVLKLIIVFVLQLVSWDKLILYGILMCFTTIIVGFSYFSICKKIYRECKFKLYWEKKLFKEIISYIGWNLLGTSVSIFKFQMVNILLNQFFNSLVIASRGIASQVNSAVTSFSLNFSIAIRPQIIKNYAAGKKEETFTLVFRGAKAAYFLMYAFILPLILEMPLVLSLWLKNPPKYAVLFTRLVLFDALIDSISYPIVTLAQATEKIKLYQLCVCGILLLNLPISWVVLLSGSPAYTVMIVAIVLTFAAFLLTRQ